MSYRDGVERIKTIWNVSEPRYGDSPQVAEDRLDVRGNLLAAGLSAGMSAVAAIADVIGITTEHAGAVPSLVVGVGAAALSFVGGCRLVDAHDGAVALAAAPAALPYAES